MYADMCSEAISINGHLICVGALAVKYQPLSGVMGPPSPS